MPPGSDGGGSTVRRIQLGARLRALRLAKGLSREQAGFPIRASESKISRMELGRVGFKERDVADLLTLYEVADAAERERLLALTREANEPSWWHTYGDVLDTWFQNYLDLEQAAEMIRTYEIQFVPGLLQTDAYARAVIKLGLDNAGPAQVDDAAVTLAGELDVAAGADRGLDESARGVGVAEGAVTYAVDAGCRLAGGEGRIDVARRRVAHLEAVTRKKITVALEHQALDRFGVGLVFSVNERGYPLTAVAETLVERPVGEQAEDGEL